jgi:chaperone modulatory protein CbpM
MEGQMQLKRTEHHLLKRSESRLPARSGYIAWSQVIELTGIHPWSLGELIEMGWIEPVLTEEREYLFHPADVYRLRKFERIFRDLEVSSLGASIIVDLLERIEHLEKRVSELSRLL